MSKGKIFKLCLIIDSIVQILHKFYNLLGSHGNNTSYAQMLQAILLMTDGKETVKLFIWNSVSKLNIFRFSFYNPSSI